MPVVDARGRLFGAINLIDLGMLLFVALLIPLGYGAYVLFRTPPPRVLAVVPGSFAFVRGAEQRAQVHGQYLRPALRAKLGTTSANAFSLQTPEAAEIRFSDLPPGTYDVALFDESQEVARLKAALTILPPPVQIVGRFVGSAADDRLVRGLKLGAADLPAELLDIDPNRADGTRRATLRVTCVLSPDNQCLVGGTAVRPGAELKLPLRGTTNPATFVVDELRADATWLPVKVRLLGLPDALDRARSGDIDVRADQGPSASPIAGVNSGAILLSLGPRQKNQGSYAITVSRPQGGADVNAYTLLSAAVPADAQAAEVIVPVESSPAGPVYRGVPVRPGSIVPFETASYRIEALIVSIPPS